MSRRSQRSPRLIGRGLPLMGAAALVLSACGGGSPPDSLLTAPADEQLATELAQSSPNADVEPAVAPDVVAVTASLRPAPPTTAPGAVIEAQALAAPEANPATTPTTPAVELEPKAVEAAAPAAEAPAAAAPAAAGPAAAAPGAAAPAAAPATPDTSVSSTTTVPASTTSAAPATVAPTTTVAAPTTVANTQPPQAQIVEFRIAPGTGKSSPWNSFGNPVRVKVGQILRIYNDDSVAHTVHAGGSPFRHGKRIDPGSYRDHPILSAHQPVQGSPRLYEHGQSRSAAFWVVAEG